MISIVNYGIGNVGSVSNMLRHIGAEAQLASSIEEVEQAKALLLPGVGAFSTAMQKLHALGLTDVLKHRVLVDKVPILGICLGMQLLGTGSEESDLTDHEPGLGLIDASFSKFRFPKDASLKVPHMGWNTVLVKRPNPILDVSDEERRFYFVHSYYARCNDDADIIATANYGHEFVCAYGHENILGTQFHPEKSHKYGMNLLQKFAAFAC